MEMILKTDEVQVILAALPEAAQIVYHRIKDFRHEWIWQKPDGTHEHVLVFSPTAKFTYKPIMDRDLTRGKRNKLAFIERTKRKKTKPTTNNGKVKPLTETVIISGQRYPSSVQFFETLEELREYMRLTYTDAPYRINQLPLWS